MSGEKYEYKTVNLSARDKTLWDYKTIRVTTKAAIATEKLSKEGWELVSTTSDFMGNPRVLTFRKVLNS